MKMVKNILICDPITKLAVDMFRKEGFKFDQEFGMSKEELTKRVPPYQALIVRSSTKVRKPTIDAAKNLEAIGRPGIGLDNIDVDYAKEKGIDVYNTPNATTISVAELTLAHILAASRHIVKGTKSLREGKWIKRDITCNEICGKTIGIIGYGSIGKAVAKRADIFGMKVIAYDIREIEDSAPAQMVSFEELLEKSDVITIHVPYNKSTHHLISGEELEKMKNTGIIVDASRGGIVDETALYNALINNELKFACKDVFEEEPPENNPLLKLSNFYATPHIGGQTEEGQIKAGTLIAEKIIEALKNKG